MKRAFIVTFLVLLADQALKIWVKTHFFLGEYVTTTNTVNEWLSYSPAGIGHFASSTTRAWTDANGDFVTNCDLLNPAGNGECGPMDNQNFGKILSAGEPRIMQLALKYLF